MLETGLQGYDPDDAFASAIPSHRAFTVCERGSPRHSPPGSSTKRLKTYKYTILIHPADPDESGYWVDWFIVGLT
jgi:hypothetical protein